MRILIFGHSDTAGFGLRDPGQAWPRLLEAGLRTAGLADAEVVHRRFNILRPGPVGYIDSQVGMLNPDVFVLPLTGYTFSLPLVSVSVRRRFGASAERLYLRFEAAVSEALTPEGQLKRRTNALARRFARRVLGQATQMPLATAIEMHEEVIRALSAREGLRVVVISTSLNAHSFQQREPWANSQIHAFNSALQRVAAEHRMEWVAQHSTTPRRK